MVKSRNIMMSSRSYERDSFDEGEVYKDLHEWGDPRAHDVSVNNKKVLAVAGTAVLVSNIIAQPILSSIPSDAPWVVGFAVNVLCTGVGVFIAAWYGYSKPRN